MKQTKKGEKKKKTNHKQLKQGPFTVEAKHLLLQIW